MGQFDQRLGTVAYQVQHLRAKRRQTRVGTLEPGLIAAICRDLFHQQIARGQIHEYQHHALEERFIHRADDRAYLAMGNALLFPLCGRFQNVALQCAHGHVARRWDEHPT